MKKKILVCGGAGFIGSNFCNLNKEKYEIIAFDNLFLGDEKNLDSDIKFIKGDAGNLEDLEKIGKVDFVLNLAGTSSAPMFMEDGVGLAEGYTNSIKSFTTVLEWARKIGVKKVLYASTSSLYGNIAGQLKENSQLEAPLNHYAITKGLYEDCSACYNKVYPEMDIIGFRFMSVYGPNEEAKGMYANLISQFCWDIAREKSPIIFGDGTQTRDFTNVKDVVGAIILAIESEKKFGAEIFNIGTGKDTSLNDVISALEDAFGKKSNTKYIENPVKEGYVKTQLADISKITKVLGFKAKVDLKNGIFEQVKNLKMEKIRETSSDSF